MSIILKIFLTERELNIRIRKGKNRAKILPLDDPRKKGAVERAIVIKLISFISLEVLLYII
jgi:hypothetical protein